MEWQVCGGVSRAPLAKAACNYGKAGYKIRHRFPAGESAPATLSAFRSERALLKTQLPPSTLCEGFLPSSSPQPVLARRWGAFLCISSYVPMHLVHGWLGDYPCIADSAATGA